MDATFPLPAGSPVGYGGGWRFGALQAWFYPQNYPLWTPKICHLSHTGEAPRFSDEKMQKVNLFETPQMFCDIYCLEPGQEQKVHAHAGATKFYYVIEGEALVTIGAETRRLAARRAGVVRAG